MLATKSKCWVLGVIAYSCIGLSWFIKIKNPKITFSTPMFLLLTITITSYS